MQIHTVKKNEKLSDIAKQYGVDEEILRMNNGLAGCEAAVGEEVVILTPTRTYTVARGDTPERISLRFGVPRSELMAINPGLSDGMTVGRRLAIRYGERTHGIAPSNGYLYPECDKKRLAAAMPYLTYVTVCAAASEGTRSFATENIRTVAGELTERGRIPLLRIYKRDGGSIGDGAEREKYIKGMIELATKHGFKGIVLAGLSGCDDHSELLVELRKNMLGCDLILVTEMTRDSHGSLNEYSDASIFEYSDINSGQNCSFKDGDGRAIADFATTLEGSKSFIGIGSFATSESGYREIRDVIREARSYGRELHRDEETLNMTMRDRGGVSWCFPSLKKIKAVLDLMGEYGFMGMSFDIMRTPHVYLAMYNAMYKAAVVPTVHGSSRCNPDG